MFDALGWVATAIFAGSYFVKTPAVLRRLQALAAVLWIAYGIALHALPVIGANLLIAILAMYSSVRRNRMEQDEASSPSV